MKPKDLRDEFALAALPGCLKLCFEDEKEGQTYRDEEGNRMLIPEVVATMCGEIADAMMAEREKTKDYPKCSGNPASCPENEGYGCCGGKA